MFPKALAVALIFASSLATAVSLDKRASFSGEGCSSTNNLTGLGACGRVNTASQMVAALGHLDFDTFSGGDPGIAVTMFVDERLKRLVSFLAKGKSVVVEIVDRCAGCKGKFDLDFSPAAFKALANPDAGRIPITWEFV